MIADWSELAAVLDADRTDPADVDGLPRASVAAVFRNGETAGTELLFIQRAVRHDDPWSGHMAFPGGRHQVEDASAQATAMRETAEEVGLDLAPARPLGTLTDLDGGQANRRFVLVSGHGFWLDGERPRLQPNHEVADVVWVPLQDLADPDRYVDHHYPPADADFPGIRLDGPDQVVWGLTLRFLGDLFRRLGRPFIVD